MSPSKYNVFNTFCSSYLCNHWAAKLHYDRVIRHKELAFNCTSPGVRLGSLSSKYRSQGCLQEATVPGQIMPGVPWRPSCTNEIMFQRTSRPSSRGTSNDKRTMYRSRVLAENQRGSPCCFDSVTVR